MKTIRCAYCGSEITAYMDDSGLPWDAKVVIECDDTSCGAIWDASGNVTRTPEQYRAEVEKLAESYRSQHRTE